MISSKTVLAAVCLIIAIAVPTAAVTVGENHPTDVVLEPTSQYASVDANDDIRLDLEALNKRAITTADDVFTITVNDDAVERIWIEQDDGLEFYDGTDRTAKITKSSPLEPSAGDTTSIGVAVDTRGDHESTETFTVHVAYDDEDDDDPADIPKGIALESFEVHPTTVNTGDSVTVNATYRNNGPTTKQVTSELTVDGTVVDAETLELAPNETASVGFERRMQWPGTYEVGVDGSASESVTVEGPSVDVLSASITTTEITAGETTTVEATVANPTDQRVDRTLELAIDGIVVDTRAVTLEPDSERTVAFERQFGEAGTYDIAVSGVEAGSVAVTERAPFPILNRELSAATTAALAPPMTMGFLFLAAAANRRWAFVPRR